MPSHKQLGSDFVSIVVADSSRIHTQLLADALRNDRGLQVVAAASNSEELLAAVTRVPIDVVVISHDLDKQAGHGTQVLREMRALRPQIKGVILLDSSKPIEVLECFRAGARGIFSKEEGLETLCKCIRIVHEGQVWARSIDLDHALEALANAPLVRATNHEGIELLSTRERQVIQHLAGGLSNREIAAALGLSAHTVKNYLFRIFDKLGVSSRTELLYLTMSAAQAQTQASANGENTALTTITAAEAGDVSAQLLLAQNFCQIEDSGIAATDGQPASSAPDPVSAYMWCVIAEKTATRTSKQIDAAKTNAARTLSPQQLAEAESKAEAWWIKSGEQSLLPINDQPQTQEQRKMQAAAQ